MLIYNLDAARSRTTSCVGEASHVSYALDDDVESGDEDYIDAEGV